VLTVYLLSNTKVITCKIFPECALSVRARCYIERGFAAARLFAAARCGRSVTTSGDYAWYIQCGSSRDSARHSKWGVARAEVLVVGEALVAVLSRTL